MKTLAIVGMACRFPKGLESIDQLWNALVNRFSAIDTVPADRWSVERYFSSNPVAKGKSYIQRGGFLSHDIHRFDAGFFGISPRDAENMDPQQRLLLEVVWEAFENSGMILPEYSGKKVGVYVGGFMLDHMITQMSASNRSQINQNTAAGMMMTMLSNRISHTYDFRGPSLSIDTACSSSLVAFHYACQDLWRGQSEMAVVGGSNVMLRPEYPMGMCKGHFLSRDGECKSFDARGDGYGRGEGAGIVLLKPLEDALRDGDPVLATVLATGSNQDGRTPGISMPSRDAQQALIEDVCQSYGIDPASIRYVECHGTGTAIGDPTETKAIGAVYGKARGANNPVVVGSIKSNIGHLEAAAGVAGIIKATLTLIHRQSTPLANLQESNPEISTGDLNVRLSDDLISLGDEEEDIRVAVNSFGYGGSNAHVILQSAPVKSDSHSNSLVSDDSTAAQPPGLPRFLPLSGRSEQAVADLAARYANLLKDGADLDNVLYSASHHRAHLSHRAVVKGVGRDELIAALEAVAEKAEHTDAVRGTEPFQGRRQPVFVFTGMGPQWWAMGQELYQTQPIYRAAVDEADAVFQEISGFSILAEMLRSEDESRVTFTEYAQPANFMIQIGVLAVVRAAGVHPGAIVGHSVGELGSAYAAGVLSLRDALTVCFHRSQLQATCKGTGAMLAVGLSRKQAEDAIAECADLVSIAAVNGPTNITLAGDADELAEIALKLTADEVFNRKLDVEVPYHSPMMDPIMEALKTSLADVQPALPSVPLFSTVTGAAVEGITYGADYWPLNVRQPVEFANAIATLLEDGFNTFLEIGPHPVLATSIRDCAKVAGKDCRTLYTLRRSMPETTTLHRGIMSVFAEGCELDWYVHNQRGTLIQLPNYAWQREYYWLENDRAVQDRIAPVVYPMLGIQEAPGVPAYRNDFDHEPMLYLRDHVVTGMPILPAAGYVEILLELASVHFNEHPALTVRNLQINAPMIITAERGLDCVTSYEPQSRTATIRSLENGRLGFGQVHVNATIGGLLTASVVTRRLPELLSQVAQLRDIPSFYADLNAIGLSYGPAFQSIRELRTCDSGDRVLARIEMQPELTGNVNQYCLHPTVLDACFQSLIVMLGTSDTTYLPTGFSELCVYSRNLPATIWCLGERRFQDERHIDCDLTLMDEDGNVLAAMRTLRSTAAARRERTDNFGDPVKRQILSYEWSYGETLSEPRRLGHWLVVGEDSRLSRTLLNQMESFGATISGIATFSDNYSRFENRYTLRSHVAEDADRMLNDLGDLDGVVFLHGLAATSSSADPTAEQAIGTLLTVTQAMLRQNYKRCPRCWVVTQSAFHAGPSDRSVDPAQTAINGFARVAFNELEGFQFSTVDLPGQLAQETVEGLILELLCDDIHDEVALRGRFRLHSELLESDMLSNDRVLQARMTNDAPVLVRPLRKDVESVGTARVVATQLPIVGEEDVLLKIQTTMVPSDLLLNPTADAIEQPVVEVVAEILSVGDRVTDLSAGDRVCGFVPADLASHMVCHRSQLHLTVISPDADALALVTTLGTCVRIQQAIDAIAPTVGDSVLIDSPENSSAIAEAFLRRGLRVAVLADAQTENALEPTDRLQVFSRCPEGISDALRSVTQGRGFDTVVAPLRFWNTTFDFAMLRPGGSVIDLDVVSQPLSLPGHAGAFTRTDYRVLIQQPQKLATALQEVVASICDGSIVSEPALEVSIADIAWQKLPLAESGAKLVLNFETQDADLPVVQTDDLQFSSEATWLITGGFGGFGQKTAQWLVANGARHLVLTGRTGADTAERKAFVAELQQQGACVLAAACDTSDMKRLTELFRTIDNQMPPLRGVFHSGAQIIDQPIADMDHSTFAKVMQSKALGAWNLHLLTRDRDLDCFVMYSSIANLVGNSRQSGYSAANGYLNGLAHMRQLLGLPGTSVNWGAIADVGVVAQDEKLEQFLRYTGLRGMMSSEGLDLLKIGLARNTPQFGVTLITSWQDWARFETRGSTSPRFASLIAADSAGRDTSMRDALIAELSNLEPADQVVLLASLIVEIIASVLRSDPADIAIDRSIDSLGVDSLMATEIQMLLDSNLGLSVSILELIGNVTVRTLATQCLKTLTGAVLESSVAVPAS